MRQGNSESQCDGDVRRRLLIAAIFLLAGAVVNVAVAWGCAILVDFRVADKVVGGAKGRRGDWVIWHHDAGGCIRIRALAVSGNNIEELEQYPMQPWVLPSWGPLAEQVRQQVGEPFLRVADAYGWPTHSMCPPLLGTPSNGPTCWLIHDCPRFTLGRLWVPIMI